MDSIRIFGAVKQSIVDGPGLRFALFTQGCPHACPGCHNPESHDPGGGYDCAVETVLKHIDANPLLTGVTLSGGEPFSQAAACLPLARAVKERGLNLMAYSGYRYEELLALGRELPEVLELLDLLDYLVDGRFELDKRSLALPFRGSSNQRILDMKTVRETGVAEHVDL